jgi:ABC-2 type transport system permease protein
MPARAVPAPAVSALRTGMSLWRLEWLRLTRTPRALALGLVFVVIGLIEPVATKFENRLLGHVGGGVKVTLPPPTPAVGLNSYVSEATLIGLILVVAFTAGAMNFDTRPGLATFLRTRVASRWQLAAPRFALNASAAAAAYVLGTLGAWYETQLLIGPLPVGAMLAGMLCGVVYFILATAVTAFAAALVRGTIGAVGTALGLLILLPVASVIRPIASWLPSALVGAPASLVNGSYELSHFAPALAIAAAGAAAALAAAVRLLGRREI